VNARGLLSPSLIAHLPARSPKLLPTDILRHHMSLRASNFLELRACKLRRTYLPRLYEKWYSEGISLL
jgi:hypothetical protein